MTRPAISIAFKRVCKLTKGRNPVRAETPAQAGSVPLINMRLLRTGVIDSFDWVSPEDALLCKPGDLLIACDGAGAGQPFFAPIHGAVGSTFAVLSPSPLADVPRDLRFVYYWLLSQRKQVQGNLIGSAIPHLNTDALRNLKIQLPPLETQKLIASYLDAKIGLMRLHSQMDKVVLHRLKTYRQSLISEVVTHGIPSENAENDATPPSLDTKKISPWPMVALKRFASFETGATPPSKEEQWYAPGIPWATIGDLNTTLLTETKKQVTAEAVAKFAIPVANPGDLLFSFKLSVGATAISAIKTATNEAIAIFRPSSGYCLQWAKYAFAVWVPRNAIVNIYDAPLLNAQRIRNARVPLPPLDEQKAIAAYLDDKIGAIDQMIAIQERRPAQHEVLIANAISEAVSGEFEPSADLIAQLSAKLDFAYQHLTAKSLADPLVAKHMRHLIPGLSAQLRSHSTGTDGTDATAAVEPPDFDDNEEQAASDDHSPEQD